jgi:hypothetical protein
MRFDHGVITRADQTCIVAVGKIDVSGPHVPGRPSDILFALSLQPKQPDQDPTGSTRLRWAIRDLLANTDPSGSAKADEDMLNAAVEDFGARSRTRVRVRL